MKISVIIPVYRVEEYLEQCVRSVLDQTMPDFEIILVDDGSPDRCPQLCDELALQDTRIKVIHKQNGGLSSARNEGMKIASGEFLFFLDSDDFIHPQTLEVLLKIAEEENSDISCCNYQTTGERSVSYSQIKSPVSRITFTNEEALEKMYDQSLGMTVIACAKLYRRELFEGIQFPEGCLHEDEFTTYKVYYRAKRISYTDQKLYYYYQNPESIMHVSYKLKRLDALRALKERLVFLEKEKLTVPYQLTQRLYLIQLMEHYYQVSKLGKHPEILSQIKTELKVQMKQGKSNPYFLLKHKLSWMAFCISPAIFHKIYQMKLDKNSSR